MPAVDLREVFEFCLAVVMVVFTLTVCGVFASVVYGAFRGKKKQ